MSYKIIVDSCGEFTEEMKQDEHFASVPLQLDVDDYHVVDDETFDQQEFLKRVKESHNSPKSSCPSPQSYIDAMAGDAEHIYIVTLSSKLSGSYNSAVLAKNMYMEEHDDKQIHVVDSQSASLGETVTALRIQELEKSGLSFTEVVAGVEKHVKEMATYFVLETLETLRKAGRISGMKALAAGMLNIKPVMKGEEGVIKQAGQARGINKALDTMVKELVAASKNCEQKILGISHCNCPERAQLVKEKAQQLAKFKDIIVLNTAGVSTMYANDGGIIMVV